MVVYQEQTQQKTVGSSSELLCEHPSDDGDVAHAMGSCAGFMLGDAQCSSQTHEDVEMG